MTLLTTLSLLGVFCHVAWWVYAVFGAFASVYGQEVSLASRWRRQASMGMLLTAAVLTGTVVALVPPGALFLVFAVATCSSVPSTAPLSSPRRRRSLRAPRPSPSFSVRVKARLLRANGTSTVGVRTVLHPAARRRVQTRRCAAAVLVPGVVATASGIDHPYRAMMAAVVPMGGADFEQQVVRALPRLAGTLVGLVVAWGLLEIRVSAAARCSSSSHCKERRSFSWGVTTAPPWCS